MNNKIIIWALRIIPAIILLQTLFFKFSASPESVYIFTEMGIEPWGRIASGVTELVAAILLLIPRTTLLGALTGAGVMAGAIASHVLVLGLVVMDDGGQLFIYALVTFICCAILIFINKNQIPKLLKFQL